MGRSPCCVKEGLNRGAWTPTEDKILSEYIKVHGEGKWRSLPKRAGLKRCGKSCRLRWLNYLRPDIKRGNITDDEEDLIIRLHKLLGNRWSLIAGRLPGRTDNEIKNYWNTNISKRIERHANESSRTTRRSGAKKNINNNIKSQVLVPPPLLQKEGGGGSFVVRTKASRCTKVFINAEGEHSGIMAVKAPPVSTTEDDFDKTSGQPAPGGASPSFSREDISSDFINVDFGMDEKFLSEFLQAEFITQNPFDFDMEIANNVLNPRAVAINGPSPHQRCQNASLFSAEELEAQQPQELGAVASLLDPAALDWLQD